MGVRCDEGGGEIDMELNHEGHEGHEDVFGKTRIRFMFFMTFMVG
jgi:hypothetical protein